MPLFGWTAKDYFGTQKKAVLKTHAKIKKTQEKSRKRELEKLEKQTEVYEARAKHKRAKHAASHPFEKSGGFGLGKKVKKLGKSGRMRVL